MCLRCVMDAFVTSQDKMSMVVSGVREHNTANTWLSWCQMQTAVMGVCAGRGCHLRVTSSERPRSAGMQMLEAEPCSRGVHCLHPTIPRTTATMRPASAFPATYWLLTAFSRISHFDWNAANTQY